MLRDRRTRTLLPALGLLLLPAGLSGRALAYEPDTTLAGLTQQAALASHLHRRLSDRSGRFGLSLGLFEPLRLDLSHLPPKEARDLRLRLRALSPTEGYAPLEEIKGEPAAGQPLGGPILRTERQTALGWLMAGSVIESTPSFRVRHHFLDPRDLSGLHRQKGQTAAGASLQAVNSGLSSFRELMTGAAFDGTGESALDWLADPHNELGLSAFRQHSERAVTAERPEERQDALARALLSAGAILSLLEQMGDPAHVRNDFEQALLLQAGRYQRFVASRYGRAGVPAPAPEAPEGKGPPLHLRDLFVDNMGGGLAERTAARFLSPGSLPGSGWRLPAGASFQSAETPEPPGGFLGGWRGLSGYVATKDVPHLLAWWRTPYGVRYALDERCQADYAALLLPEIGRYAAQALDLLFRDGLSVTLGQGDAGVQVSAGDTALGPGTLVLLGETAEGRRQKLATQPSAPAAAGAALGTLAVPDKAPGYSRLVVLFTGEDAAGEPLSTSASLELPKAD